MVDFLVLKGSIARQTCFQAIANLLSIWCCQLCPSHESAYDCQLLKVGMSVKVALCHQAHLQVTMAMHPFRSRCRCRGRCGIRPGCQSEQGAWQQKWHRCAGRSGVPWPVFEAQPGRRVHISGKPAARQGCRAGSGACPYAPSIMIGMNSNL